MAKDTFYFSHDYNTRTDDKIKPLIRKHGMVGYGIFWAIVEDLYNNANALRLDYDGIAYDLRVDAEMVKSIINDFDLFSIEGGIFGSVSVQERLEVKNSKTVNARKSAFKRWGKDADAMPMQSDGIENICEPNAIKERKRNKGKEIKERKEYNLPFTSEKFLESWNTLLSSKKWKNKSELAITASINKLAKETEPDALKMLDNAIAGDWQGLHELKPHERVKTPVNENSLKSVLRKEIKERHDANN